ncbi:MAG: hypothetical protein FJY54_08765 [Betaproteobacteria bacterium]|nr:hypothetical protein [Betaproteobacteria bacterium]
MSATTLPDFARRGSRRRISAWLIAGWAAFWLVSVLHPCCGHSIGDAHAAHPLSAGLHASSYTDECVDNVCATRIKAIAVPQIAFAVPAALPELPTVSFAAPLRLAGYGPEPCAALHAANAPPSSVPIYLRTARLLI